MACGTGWRIAFAALGLYCVCLGCPHAADDEDATTILFSGRDLWRNGAFAYGGFVVAPNGFDDDGLMIKLMISGGVYRYNSGYLGEEVVGAEWLGQSLVGWRIKRFGVETKVYFGPDWERHKLWPDDPGIRLRGVDFGVRMAAEFWTEPTASTMLTGEVSLSTVATNHPARIAGGWRVLEDMFEDGVYVGPEVL